MLMEGFSMVFGDPLSIVLVAAGTLIGTIFGAIPGLTATMAVTICLPMTFAMARVQRRWAPASSSRSSVPSLV